MTIIITANIVPSALYVWFSNNPQTTALSLQIRLRHRIESNLPKVKKPGSPRMSLGEEWHYQSYGLLLNTLKTVLTNGHPASAQLLQRQITACLSFLHQGRILPRYLFVNGDPHFILSPPAAVGPSMLLVHHFTHLWLAAFPIPSVAILNLKHPSPPVPLPSLFTQGQWFHWLPHWDEGANGHALPQLVSSPSQSQPHPHPSSVLSGPSWPVQGDPGCS